jgi:hypothetical protein
LAQSQRGCAQLGFARPPRTAHGGLCDFVAKSEWWTRREGPELRGRLPLKRTLVFDV